MGTLDDMAVFARVVEEKSFTAAGRALGLPKSTVSRRIAELEARLETQLLQRTTRSLRVTAPGARYYAHCARVVAEATEAHDALRSSREQPNGLLRVTAPLAFGSALLARPLARFLATYPEVWVEVFLSDASVNLVREGFDVSIRVGRALADSSHTARLLGQSPLVICASPSYVSRRGAPRAPRELGAHDCVVHSGAAARWALAGPGGRVNVRIDGRARVNSLPLVHAAALAGAGIATLPAFLCSEDLAAGRLVAILHGWTVAATRVYAVFPSARQVSPAVRSFVDVLADHFAK